MMNSENKSIKNREIHLDPLEEFSFDTNDCSLVKTEEIIHTSNTKKGIALQIDRIIEKNEGLWRCKVCGKNTLKNTNIRAHAERHIEGVSHTCPICIKHFQPDSINGTTFLRCTQTYSAAIFVERLE